MVELFANSGDPDQTPRSAASDLGLHCLPITLLGVTRLQWVNCIWSKLQFYHKEGPLLQNTLLGFLSFLTSQITYITSCLLSIHLSPPEKGSTLKGNNLLPFSDGRQNSLTVDSLASVLSFINVIPRPQNIIIISL